MTDETCDNAAFGAATWAARASMLELLALSFRYPGPDLPGIIGSGQWADAAREIAAALGMTLPEGFGDGLACDGGAAAGASGDAASGAALHALRAEATRLFVGAPTPAVSPYEGIWRAVDDGVQPLLFVNPHSMDVERFCRACGLGRPEGTNEPLDHASTELELLEYLASLAVGISGPVPNGPAPEDLPGGSPEAAFGRFATEHALVWMPRFADKVQGESRHPFYRDAAALLGAFLQTLE